MKEKPKAGRKSQVACNKREQARMPFEPFRFERWTDADLHPPLVTMESKIAEFREAAKRETAESLERKALSKPEQALRCNEMAKENRVKAAKWRKLAALPEAKTEGLDWRCYENLAEGVDFLIARSGRSDSASMYLSMLIGHALRGLHALAAHEKPSASTFLVDRLLEGVRRFEFLASHRPELFTQYTRRLAVIPATISRQKENAEECAQLMVKLQVSTNSLFSIAAKGKQWRESTPVNGLAVRLVRYIENNRWQSSIYLSHPELYANWPEWFQRLARLKDFGAGTWDKWAEVAWAILFEVTKGKPQEHPDLQALGKSAAKKQPKDCKPLGELSKAANVRAKIKERLLEAFETIAGNFD